MNQPEKISREIAEKEYENYKAQWEEKNNQAFFKSHYVSYNLFRLMPGSRKNTTPKLLMQLSGKEEPK